MLNRLTAIAVGALLLMAVACGTPASPHDPQYRPKAHILASSLRSAYLDNPVSFELQYHGDTVSAYGKVRRIRLDKKVEFREGFLSFGDLVCTFQKPEEVAGLWPGKEITITGMVQSVDGWYVHLRGCRLAGKSDNSR